MATSKERVAEEIARIKARLDRLARSPQLANSSLENASLKVKNAAGDTTMIIGTQYDGTAVAAVVNGPTPPTPYPPQVSLIPNGAVVTWSGQFADPQPGFTSPVVVPMDFARIDIHANDTPTWTINPGTKYGEILAPGGGTTTVSVRNKSTWGVPVPVSNLYWKFVCVSLTGKMSTPSDYSFPGTVPNATDVDYVNAGINAVSDYVDQKVALTVAKTDTGWQSLGGLNGWSSSISYRVKNEYCTVVGLAQKASGSQVSGQAAVQLPTNARPTAQLYLTSSFAGTMIPEVNVKTDGTISVNTVNLAGGFTIHAVFPVG